MNNGQETKTAFDLETFKAKRDAAIEAGTQWDCEVQELKAAYAAGEKGFCSANLEDANLYGANLEDANLEGANLYGANLEGAYLKDANLYGANLKGANLYGANLKGAYLEGAYLKDANLYGANLKGANLYGANLKGANLKDANLKDASLYGANGIQSIGPVGDRKRIIFAYVYENTLMFRAGCRTANESDLRAAIDKDYANKPEGHTEYMAAVDYLVAWGAREIKRQQEGEK